MRNMIERVALAIANAKRAKHDIRPCRWEHLTDEAKTEYAGYARAAIEAMREPTDEMINALWAKEEEMQGGGCGKQIFIAALDEALK